MTPSQGHLKAPSSRVGPNGVAPHRVAADVTIQIVGRLVNLALGVVVTVLLVRALGDARFGEWSALLAVVTLAGTLCDLGLLQVAVRHAAADPEGEPEWIGALLQLRLILSIPAFVLCAVVVVAISSNQHMLAAGLVLSATLLLAAPSALSAVFRLRVRNDLMIVAMTVQSVIWAGFVIAVFVGGGGLVVLAVGFLVAAIAYNLVTLAFGLRHGRVRFEGARQRWREITRIGVPIALGSVLILGYGRIDQILVLVLAGPEDAGRYSAVYRVLDQSQFVAVSVSTTTFALLAATFTSDVPRFKELLQVTTELLIAFSLGALVFSLAYAEPFVVLLFGQDFAPAAPALPVLLATLVLVSLGYVVGSLVIFTERQRPFVAICAAGLVFNVAFNVILVPIGGFMAAAWITLATEILVLSLAWLSVRSKLPARLGSGRFPKIILAAVLSLGLLLVLRVLGLPVLAAMGALAVGYPLLLLGVRAVSIGEIRTLRQAAT